MGHVTGVSSCEKAPLIGCFTLLRYIKQIPIGQQLDASSGRLVGVPAAF